jgi:hypothetical protein
VQTKSRVYSVNLKNCHPELDSGSKQPINEILNKLADGGDSNSSFIGSIRLPWILITTGSFVAAAIYYMIALSAAKQSLYAVSLSTMTIVVPLSIIAAFWEVELSSLRASGSQELFSGGATQLSKLTRYTAFAGITLIFVSPFFDNSVIITNSISVIENFIFIAGFSVFISAISLCGMLSLVNCVYAVTSAVLKNRRDDDGTLYITAQLTSCAIYFLVILSLIISYYELDKITNLVEVNIKYYYEILFYSFTHLLKYLYIQIAIILGHLILQKFCSPPHKFTKIFIFLLLLNCAVAIYKSCGRTLGDIASPIIGGSQYLYRLYSMLLL